jgi:hypothetical protein
LGEIVNMVAYADWRVMARATDREYQYMLTRMGVETRNLVSIQGKNSADMRIADDIRSLLDRKPTDPRVVDVVVLCSSDRDFRPLMHTAKMEGQKMLLLALEKSTGSLLKNQVNGHIRYFKPNRAKFQPRHGYTKGVNYKELWPEDNDHSKLAVQIAMCLERNGQQWAPAVQIASELSLGKGGAKQIRKLVEDTVCNTFRNENDQVVIELNHEHKIALIASVLSQCLREYSEAHGSAPPNSDALVLAILRDPRCAKVGLGPNIFQVEAWLKVAIAAGLLADDDEPGKETPGRPINP